VKKTSAKTAAAPAPAVVWPPYGHMHVTLERAQAMSPVPQGFHVGGRQGTVDDWERFVRREVKVLRDQLWPEHDRATGQWHGAATAQMEALTRADLALCQEMRKSLFEPAPDATSEVTHLALFQREDNMTLADYFASFGLYLPEKQADAVKILRDAMIKGLGQFGAPPLRFKHYMQRPRPYQVAWMLNEAFEYRWGTTAVTAALPSGHCMQGLYASCAAWVSQRAVLEGLANGRERLALYGAHVGDRRVLAGVHYPGDNVASWYICLRMCEPMFGAQAVLARDFMVDCIKSSLTYRAIDAEVKARPHSVYAHVLAWLQQVFIETPVKADP
jgi:PAP2 superfamily